MSNSAKVIEAIDVADIFEDVCKMERPKGYYSASEISKTSGFHRCATLTKLKKLREAGQIDCVQAVIDGSRMWVYKVNL